MRASSPCTTAHQTSAMRKENDLSRMFRRREKGISGGVRARSPAAGARLLGRGLRAAGVALAAAALEVEVPAQEDAQPLGVERLAQHPLHGAADRAALLRDDDGDAV